MDSQSNPLPVSRPFTHTLVKGGMVLAIARIITKILASISALFVPRWLGPNEMGLFSVAILVLAAIDAFTEPGLVSAFIQKKDDYEKYIDPLRTFNIIRGLVVGLLIFFAAPLIANWLHTPRAIGVLRAISLVPAVRGFMPMIWTLATKRLHFEYAAKYQIMIAATNILLIIPLAWILKSVWALVWGWIGTWIICVVLSTLMSKEGRGISFNLRALKDFRGFGFWIFLTAIVSYTYTSGGNWAIGRTLDVQVLAVYTLAFQFCTLITAEVANIINQMMHPVFVQLQFDLPRLQSGFRKSFGTLAMLIIGLSALTCVVARDYFVLVLGSKWEAYQSVYISLLPWLCMWGVCSEFASAQNSIFESLNKPSRAAYTAIGMLLLMLTSLWPFIYWWGALGVAISLGGTAAIMQLVRYVILSKMLKMHIYSILQHVLVPTIAGVMSVFLANAVRTIFHSSPWLQAIMAAFIVTLSYIIILMACSRLLYPNPIGVISIAVDQMRSKINKR